MFKEKIAKFIVDKQLISFNQKLLVALSGGADSVALLRVILQLGYKCEAVHCNFHLRGDESNRDEQFVRTLCSELHVSLHVTNFDTEDYARQKGLSIEMAARELRYHWFEEMREKTESDWVAVAHHLDDSVETFLLNLSRGTGINGLKGIQAKNGFVVRPLLDVTRDEILDYLQYLGQPYVTDSTNLENLYVRNKIRLDIIPLFRLINPSFSESVSETAKRLTEVAAVYQDAIQKSLERVSLSPHGISISLLKKEASPSCILHEWLAPYGFNSSQIKDVVKSLNTESGKLFYAKEWQLLRDREKLLLRKNQEETMVPTLVIEQIQREPNYQVKKSKDIACLDADKIQMPLEVRKWKSGDVFMPFGMNGKKKVRDYLRDKKKSLFEKEEQLVVVSNGQIVWLVDERVDQRFSVSDTTCTILEIKVKKTSFLS